MAYLSRSSLLLSAFSASFLSSSLAAPLTPKEFNGRSTTLPTNCTAPTITFGPCPAELKYPSVLECANYSVPIDWDNPQGEHFDLGVTRISAPANSTKKIGSLFINPGGPGGSASGFLVTMTQGILDFPQELFDSFDIIGVDPRGIGLSHQVQCDQDIWAERVSWLPETEEEYNKLVDKNMRYGQSCRERTGPLLEHLDAINTMKDHEAVRIALGNEPLNMVGMSYGSLLGATYATLFPNNIRALVLDGILQHSQAHAANVLIESSAYAIGLESFFLWAGEVDSSPLKGKDVKQIWNSLIANATANPLPTPNCDGKTNCRINVTAEEILFNAQGALVFKLPFVVSELVTWGSLASAIFNATQGDASALSTRLDSHGAISGTAIACLDYEHEFIDFPYMKTIVQMGKRFNPKVRAAQMLSLTHSCIGWPYNSTYPLAKMDVDTKTTILTVGSDGDPSTGYPWAVGFQQEIRNSVFVTRIGDGHTSFPIKGETQDTIMKYLLNGEVPEDGSLFQS